jgi:hypothetical protein
VTQGVENGMLSVVTQRYTQMTLEKADALRMQRHFAPIDESFEAVEDIVWT